MIKSLLTLAALATATTASQAATLHDNGPVVAANGKSTMTAPQATLGFSIKKGSNHAVADDFTVGGAGWVVDSIDFFAYQNNAASFTLQTVSWSIMAGDVNNGTLVASGITTLTNGGLVGQRVAANPLDAISRPIYRANADIADVNLAAGHYWLRWNMTGSLSSGPWQSPAAGVLAGNSMKSVSGAAFTTIVDGGATLEMPFVLNGTVNAVPEPSGALMLLAGGLAVAAIVRRRRAG